MDREKIVERDFMGLSNSDEIAEKKETDAGTKDLSTDVPVDDGSHNSSSNNVPCQRFGAPPIAYSAGSTEGLSSSAHPGAEYGVFPSSNLSFPMQSFGQHLGPLSILKGQQAVSGACGAPSMANPSPIQHSFFPDFAGVYPSTRATSKSTSIPGNPPSAQLTIFYAGTVNVYDDIPADKAQGLMLLAASARPTKMTNQPPRSSLMSMVVATGGHTPISSPFPPSLPNRVCSMTPQAPLQKPQASSQPNPSAAVSLSTGDSQANQNLATSISQQEASMSSATVITPAPVAPRAVPQARKASLARFLEKRKERIGTKAPYPTKKSPDDASPQREQSPSSKHSSPPLDGCLTKKHQLNCTGMEEKIPLDSENNESYLDEDQKEHLCLQKIPKIEQEECGITV